jgi:hypothetical protein
MKTMRTAQIGILAALALLSFAAGRAPAQNLNVTFDEYGNGFLNGSALSFTSSSTEPFSGQSTLMYQLPFTVTRGDLILTDGSVNGDLIRFDNNSLGGVAYFFSDLPESGENPVPLADTGVPNPSGLPSVIMPELGPEGNNGATYGTGLGNPGSALISGNIAPVTYTIVSDGTAVPEPSAFALLGAGTVLMLGFGWRRRKKSPAPQLNNSHV